MKMLRLLMLPLLVTGVIAVSAQEKTESTDAEDSPFTFKISGETVEDFKLEFIANYEVDQSSPAALVKTYAAYADNREPMRLEMESIGKKWDAAIEKSLEPEERKLLTDEAFKALHAEPEDEEDRPAFSRVSEPLKPTGKVEKGDSFVWVEAVQKTEVTRENWETGEMETLTEEERLRFRCVEGDDGNYRIDAVERWGEDWENTKDRDDPAMKWVKHTTPYTFMKFSMATGEREETPALKQSTPKEAALSLFESLIPRREALSASIYDKGIDAWVDILDGLFTDAFTEAADKQIEEWGGRDAPIEREVESVAEDNGVTIVKFKPRSEWEGSIELHMKKVGDAWKIHKAGYSELAFDTDGNRIWKFKEESDIYSYSYR